MTANAGLVLHASRVVNRPGYDRYTTQCGRMNKRTADGMNIADSDNRVTCKFCLTILARRTAERSPQS